MKRFSFDKNALATAQKEGDWQVRELVAHSSVPTQYKGRVAEALLSYDYETNGDVTVTIQD